MMKALILAGGSGTRLWPISRSSQPKQVMPLAGGNSLLAATYNRIRPQFKDDDIWLATSRQLADLMQAQIPNVKNLSLEPTAKNTAPAIGLACLRIWLNEADSVIVTVNSDHYIKDSNEYLRVVSLGGQLVAKYPDNIILVGIKTEYPEIGYGYIETEKIIADLGQDQLWQAKRFVEKPDLKTAEKYHQDHKFLWNPAIFIFRAQYMLDLFKQYLPQHYDLLMKIKDNIDDENKVAEIFSQMEAISIDYGIMERSKDLLVLPASFGWSDIGSWRAVYDILKQSGEKVMAGQYVGIDSNNNLIYSTTDKLMTTVGVKDSIIINSADALLVAPLDRSQDVKLVVEELKKKKLNKYL